MPRIIEPAEMPTMIRLTAASLPAALKFGTQKGKEAQMSPDMSAPIDMNRNDYQSGWDTDQFPNNHAEKALAFYEILRAGGYDRSPPLGRRWLPVMPLDIFEEARQVCEEDASLRMELVAYRQVPGAQAAYRFSRFPLSLGQPLRSVARALRGKFPGLRLILCADNDQETENNPGVRYAESAARAVRGLLAVPTFEGVSA